MVNPVGAQPTVIIQQQQAEKQPSFFDTKNPAARNLGRAFNVVASVGAFVGIPAGGLTGLLMGVTQEGLDPAISFPVGAIAGGVICSVGLTLVGRTAEFALDKAIDATVFVVTAPFKGASAVYSAMQGANEAPVVQAAE